MSEIRLEILKCSYWEHFKLAKDLSLILPVGHYKRKIIEKEINDISEEIKRVEESLKK